MIKQKIFQKISWFSRKNQYTVIVQWWYIYTKRPDRLGLVRIIIINNLLYYSLYQMLKPHPYTTMTQDQLKAKLADYQHNLNRIVNSPYRSVMSQDAVNNTIDDRNRRIQEINTYIISDDVDEDLIFELWREEAEAQLDDEAMEELID